MTLARVFLSRLERSLVIARKMNIKLKGAVAYEDWEVA